MKRFITYLFTYENGRKGKNVGFIRTDIRGERLELAVHLQGIGRFSGTGQVFLLVMDGTLWGIPLGGLSVSQGRGAGKFVVDMQDTGEPGYTVQAVAGAAIRFGNLYYAASSWNREAPEGLAEGTFEEWNGPGVEATPEEALEPTPEEVPEEAPEPIPEAAPEPIPEPTLEAAPEEAPKPAPEAVQQEIPLQNAESELVRLATEKLQQEQSVPEVAKTDDRKPRRIDISDIRKLPKKNWYLCNNSFLIHGFFNYRYLVLVDLEENGIQKTYLGVPGIFEKPERMMALLFGFPDFLPEGSKDKVQQASATAKPVTPAQFPADAAGEPLGSFGYWLCLLDM